MRTGIVLVGGAGRRAGGVEKYLFEFCGKTFIERLLGTLREVVDEIIIVARDREQCDRFAGFKDAVCIPDLRPGLGPIGGLHAGCLAAHGAALFVVACDMPCINGRVIDTLFDQLKDYDAVIPFWNEEMYEPLHAVYNRSAVLDYLREHKSLSLRAMIKSLNANYVDVESLRALDPDLLTFININHIHDLENFRAKFEEKTGAQFED